MKKLPSQAELRKLFDYDPATGILIRNQMPYMNPATIARFTGKPTGALDGAKGYVKIFISGKLYYAHRVIWKWVHGFDAEMIDHIDGNRANNRIENLRLANGFQNCANKKIAPRHLPRGVQSSRPPGKYVATIKAKQHRYHLGTFDTVEDAQNAWRSAAIQHHGEFARLD